MSYPAGWYPDPNNPAALRWWDGAAWTVHVAPAASAAPAPSMTAARAVQHEAPSREGLGDLKEEYEQLRAQVIETREIFLLQEVGIYEYTHPLDNSVAYRDAMVLLSKEIKDSVKGGSAVSGTRKWAINGSEREGGRMVDDICKLMLRAYNTEADNIVRTLKPYALKSARERLEKMRSSISKLGASMKIQISDAYHSLRTRELELTSDYLAKVAEEKEEEREERARLKEEKLARQEFEREQARLEKERTHYETALRALRANGDSEQVLAAEEKLSEINRAIEGIVERAANARAGYVYVISNVGSFGTEVVKIGLTRRLDPLDRVRELGDASVPFRFDVHAIIFSEDAVALETALHRRFARQRVNLVNSHREFFYVSPHLVKEALVQLQGSLLSYVEVPEALEWHQSNSARHGA